MSRLVVLFLILLLTSCEYNFSNQQPMRDSSPYIGGVQDYYSNFDHRDYYPLEKHCYWMENVSGSSQWVLADNIYHKTLSRNDCYRLDSCSGGMGESSGGCYKWSVSPSSPGESWN